MFEGFDLPDKMRAKLKNRTELKKQLAAGLSPQQILAISQETMETFYEAAYQLLLHQRYNEAAHAFLFLVTLNSYDARYWTGLGLSSQFCQEYEGALDAYEMAAICDIDDPTPYYHMAKCLFALHDRESALAACNLAIEYADDMPQFETLKKEAIKAKKILEDS